MKDSPTPNPFMKIGMTSSGPALATATRNSALTLARFRSDDPQFGAMKSLPAEDAYVLVFHRDDVPGHDFWSNGKHEYRPPAPAAALTIVDVNAAPRCRLSGRFDNVQFHIPRGALDDLADEADAQAIAELRTPDGWCTTDTVVEGMQNYLVQAIEQPGETSQLFVDHVVLALQAHVARVYGGLRESERRRTGGLASWQIRRAKELVAANLTRALSLQQVARECGLSASHFSRAFKRSTGMTPHHWLQTCRVDRAKTLLGEADRSLAEVAVACGFADQSHFIRIFARFAGSTPGSWRRWRGTA